MKLFITTFVSVLFLAGCSLGSSNVVSCTISDVENGVETVANLDIRFSNDRAINYKMETIMMFNSQEELEMMSGYLSMMEQDDSEYVSFKSSVDGNDLSILMEADLSAMASEDFNDPNISLDDYSDIVNISQEELKGQMELEGWDCR